MMLTIVCSSIVRHVRTKAEPVQPIPLFEELIELLMRVSTVQLPLEASLS